MNLLIQTLPVALSVNRRSWSVYMGTCQGVMKTLHKGALLPEFSLEDEQAKNFFSF